ncbi:unnamed protein product [Parajaminaea phylloscopi]
MICAPSSSRRRPPARSSARSDEEAATWLPPTGSIGHCAAGGVWDTGQVPRRRGALQAAPALVVAGYLGKQRPPAHPTAPSVFGPRWMASS